MEYELKPLSQEEGDNLQKELMAVLEKYDAEIGIKSTLEIMKRVEVAESVPSPLDENGEFKTEEPPKAD